MKATKFSALAALMLMAPVAQEALALPPTTTFGTTDVVLYLSGSSALQPVVGAFANSVCDVTSLDTFKDITGTTVGGNWRSYSCNLNAATIAANGLPAGTKMLLNNRNKGGSVYGVVPIQKSLSVAYMNINNGNCAETPVGSRSWNCSVTALAPEVSSVTGECDTNAVTTTSAGSVFCKKSTAGIADVEPGMFVPPNLPNVSFAAGTPTAITTTPESGVIFGILVTEHLYRDLQTAQGLKTYPAGAPDPVTNPTDWSEALRPSMKKTEVASILRGDLGNWLDVNQAWKTAGTSAGFSGAMAICRRSPGSGTQAGANAYFMENMCRASSQRAGSFNMVTGTNGAGYQVVESASTGSLLTCLNSAYNATDIPGGVPSGATFSGVTHDAIGFAGIDIRGGNPVRPLHSVPQLATDDHFDFVKLDGVSPTLANAISGDYTYWYENTLNAPSVGNANASTSVVLNLFKNAAGDPVNIRTIPLPGVAALPTPTRLWDTVANYPTMRGTRKGNSCSDIFLNVDNP